MFNVAEIDILKLFKCIISHVTTALHARTRVIISQLNLTCQSLHSPIRAFRAYIYRKSLDRIPRLLLVHLSLSHPSA